MMRCTYTADELTALASPRHHAAYWEQGQLRTAITEALDCWIAAAALGDLVAAAGHRQRFYALKRREMQVDRVLRAQEVAPCS